MVMVVVMVVMVVVMVVVVMVMVVMVVEVMAMLVVVSFHFLPMEALVHNFRPIYDHYGLDLELADAWESLW